MTKKNIGNNEEKDLTVLKEKISTKNSDLDIATNNLLEVRKERDKLIAEISEYHAGIKSLEENFSKFKDDDKKKKELLKREYDALIEKKDQIGISIINAKDTLKVEEVRLRDITDTIISKNKEKNSIEKDIEALNKIYASLNEKKTVLQGEVNKVGGNLASLEKDYAVVLENVEKANKEYSEALLTTENLIRREDYAKEQEYYIKDQFKKVGLKYVEFKA